MEQSIWIGLIINVALIQSISALICRGTVCDSMHDTCCTNRNPMSNTLTTSQCCKSVPNEWVVKTSGIGIGLTIVGLFVVIFCSCKQKIRRLTGIRQLPNELDLPPSYDTLKKANEPEPPSYFKLFPIPVTSPHSEIQTPAHSPQTAGDNDGEMPVAARENNDIPSTSMTVMTITDDSGITPRPMSRDLSDNAPKTALDENPTSLPTHGTTSCEVPNENVEFEIPEKSGHDNLALTLEPI